MKFTAMGVGVLCISLTGSTGRAAGESLSGAGGSTLASASTPGAPSPAPSSPLWGDRLFELAARTPPAPLPANPQQALIDVVARFSAALGYPQDPSARIRAAELPDEVAGRLAQALSALHACHGISAEAMRTLPPEALSEFHPGTYDELNAAFRTCAEAVYLSAVALDAAVPAADAVAPPYHLEIWPVLAYHRGGSDDVYIHDFALTVDEGGEDRYENNAGGNTLDVKRGPDDSPALMKQRARGCQVALTDAFKKFECVASSSLLIDKSGNDTYGYFTTPDPEVDGLCTSESIVRRVGTAGAGVMGVAVFMEDQGDDTYLGKTMTQGAGHLGVGIFQEKQGNDSYLAIRNSQGAAFNGATGVHRDEGGHDVREFYMPAGGIMNDVDRCDTVQRQLQGAAGGGGQGILDDLDGNDVYHAGGPVKNPNFPCGGQEQPIRGICEESAGIIFTTGHQGYGSSGGIGVFRDRNGGTDTYVTGMAGRTNNATVGPDSENLGFFIDE